MNSKALIDETLKYLERDQNNQPKYKFELYKTGADKYFKEKLKSITGGLVSLDSKEEDRVPVTVYTIGDIFATVRDLAGDGRKFAANIQELPNKLDEIKENLKQLGFSTLEVTVNTLKNAIIPMEVVRDVNQIYRVAKPLVKKVADIASIMFNYERAAEVAQDVLQYLGRTALSASKNMLDRLLQIFMDIPVFAIYENDNSENLAEKYSQFSAEANRLLEALADDYEDIITYTNQESDKLMTTPGYSILGVNVDDDIVDVYSNPITKRIFIATQNKIYRLTENYTAELIYETAHPVYKIYQLGSNLYYISVVSGRMNIYQAETEDSMFNDDDAPTWNNFRLLYAKELVWIYMPGASDIIAGTGEFVTLPSDLNNLPIENACYDIENDIFYFVFRDNSEYKLYSIYNIYSLTPNVEYLYTLDSEPSNLCCFNGYLYITKSDGCVYKANGQDSYSSEDYVYNPSLESGETDGIISVSFGEKTLATNGKTVYDVVENDLTRLFDVPTHATGVTVKTINNIPYYICTCGDEICVTQYNNGNVSWVEKVFRDGNEEYYEDQNLAGCLWYSKNDNDFFIAYGPREIYIIGPDGIEELISSNIPKTPEPLLFKETKSFKDWFNEEPEDLTVYLEKVKSLRLKDLIITGIKEVNGKLYVSLYSEKYSEENQNVSQSGVYEIILSLENGSFNFNVNLDQPVIAAGNNEVYSFDCINNCWFYTDNYNLYNYTYHAKSRPFDRDNKVDDVGEGIVALSQTIESGTTKKLIYTTTSILKSQNTNSFEKISTLVDYSNENWQQLASTRNGVFISDGTFVYNIINNEANGINYDLFQICYNSIFNTNINLIQSNDAVFIVNENTLIKLPFYNVVSSADYGCGYYTDTTPNRWYGAAPYYFASTILKENKQINFNVVEGSRKSFLNEFKENFKVELEKLLKNIPNAFEQYVENKLIKELKELNINIDGDDGQIKDLIIRSVSGNTATSLGMYIQQKFYEKIGDDDTYDTFAQNVYDACVKDVDNNMTKDFYDIFEQLYYSVLKDALMDMKFGEGGLSGMLIRYYQNHKLEWADSISERINADYVEPEIYEIPLNGTVNIKLDTYVYDYDNSQYKQVFVPKSADDIEATYSNGQFYVNGQEIDVRTKSGDTYYEDGKVLCYVDQNGELRNYKLDDYELTEDTTVDSSKAYYEVASSSGNKVSYVLSSDASAAAEKVYYELGYAKSLDITPVAGKDYYTMSGGNTAYVLQTASSLALGPYYEKKYYELTSDTEIDSEKEYYSRSFASVASAAQIVDGVQFYGFDYALTADTEIDPDKIYYEYVNFSSGTVSYKRDASAASAASAADRYNLEFTKEIPGTFDSNKTYYELLGSSAPTEEYVDYEESIVGSSINYYATAYDFSSGTDYYYVSNITQNANGHYIKQTEVSSAQEYVAVDYPQESALPLYYEYTYVKVPKPQSIDNIYIEEFTKVISPIISEISTYYEKTNDGYVQAENLRYTYNSDGQIIGIENDRNLYKAVSSTIRYNKITIGDRNPKGGGYYEASYLPIETAITGSPRGFGYYERVVNEAYTQVSSPSGNPHENGYYEKVSKYFGYFEDNRVYVDSAAEEIPSSFDDEDEDWHAMIYNLIADVKTQVQNMGDDIDVIKTKAITLTNGIDPIQQPSDVWKQLITESVTDFYIPTQGEQFRTIIRESNMYPIQWDELPFDIDHDMFDLALNTLLYMIKQRLISNVTILIDGGMVKCYSCVDASTVIKKMVNNNATIWNNQLNRIKSNISKASSKNEVLSAFDIKEYYNDSRFMLETILLQQTKLYAKYTDKLIEEQIINDNDTEVTL